MSGSLAQLLPVSLVERDGLIVTTTGAYVRLIECERVPNTVTADPTTLATIERAYERVPDDPRPPGDRRLRPDGPGSDEGSARGRC